ncbi:C6 transcription factor [Colletotrichum truncatum]|uniref:C6 transcription factor n=1 Tax=Colletotrichum truncatum TaxID=5467 RepID=A0ACC3Z3F9_COLTU|nr:C6 transcription factor [Colletotrichum truncatum]KAF6793090.1 C6 transcription factor [Colletotrichum truncatum]
MSSDSLLAATDEAYRTLDHILTSTILCIAVSGGDSKSESLRWWDEATRGAIDLGLGREDEPCRASESFCSAPFCPCKYRYSHEDLPLAFLEVKEERRRVFWLLYCLDRHLSLSHNRPLRILDSSCQVYVPLDDEIWERLDEFPSCAISGRTTQLPTTITGATFFTFFLPLMVILGNIIHDHHTKQHPYLGITYGSQGIAIIEDMITTCETSVLELATEVEVHEVSLRPWNLASHKLRLVIAYSKHILHVFHVLLHGKWDALSMLDDEDGWISTLAFSKCASHAVAASDAVMKILELDPELTFIPYLFGIYLLQGSFILLLFADRMPQLGTNESVEQACEVIIRAHEVSIVTLSTEFQRNFRRVLRSTLYSVRGISFEEWEERKIARRSILSLYRWTNGARGLCI